MAWGYILHVRVLGPFGPKAPRTYILLVLSTKDHLMQGYWAVLLFFELLSICQINSIRAVLSLREKGLRGPCAKPSKDIDPYRNWRLFWGCIGVCRLTQGSKYPNTDYTPKTMITIPSIETI